MQEIMGKHGTAISYASCIEDEALEQVRQMCDQEFASGSRIRIMPDAHVGAGCTIGTTMTVTDKVVPNLVGVDIGCGMYMVDLSKEPLDLEALDAACYQVPHGFHVWNGRVERFDLTRLRCYRMLKDTKRIERNIGTLGGGNHFVEVDRAQDGTQYLVIHSGSRNLGLQVATYYQNLAIELGEGKEAYFEARDKLIAEYKAAGRRKEIQAALKELPWEKVECDVPPALRWLEGHHLEDYLHDVELCQEFARLNREPMAREILARIGRSPGDAMHTIHNYIDTSEMILRKGSIAAHAGELVLIPINMRDGSILARGRGNAEWNYSAPHGAGRLMSRKDAKQNLSFEEYRDSMAQVYSTSVKESTLDEAPAAYKSLDAIRGDIEAAVDVVEVLKPVYNFKAS